MLVIASHLDECPACAAELAMLRWLKAAVRRCACAPESRPESQAWY
jgi:anti-sigma factor RsiW